MEIPTNIPELLKDPAVIDLLKHATASRFSREDKPIPEDDEIDAAHPMEDANESDKTRWHRYQEALRMVGAKHSKYALVDLVNWLLKRLDSPTIHIKCETTSSHGDGPLDRITGSTHLNVVRVEHEDDGSYTVVTDHWPTL